MTNKEFNTFVLPNGIRCLHKKISSPVAYCALTINAGSRDELPSEHGLAHFVEHSMFKGTKNRTSYEILNFIESKGGEVNAYTGKEETVLHAVCLNSDVECAVDIISDLVFNATFLQSKIDQEKQVIYDEQNSYVDSYPESIYDDFEDLLFKNSSLGHNILGTKRRLKKFTSEDLINFVSRCYTTDQMVFSMFSNMDFEIFKSMSEKYFAHQEKTTRSFERTATLKYNKFNKKENKGEAQVHYFMGNRAFSLEDKLRLPASLMTNMLGGQSINSLLNVALREEQGLTYNIEASITPFCDSGIFSIYFTCDKKNLSKSTELVKQQIQKMSDRDFIENILPSAKTQFKGQIRIAQESQENYMLNAARSYLIYNDIDPVEVMMQKIDEITTEQMLEVAERLFTNYSTLIYK
ncbi:MAG: pitrilysin family protein [Rikenellaceae bacterium]